MNHQTAKRRKYRQLLQLLKQWENHHAADEKEAGWLDAAPVGREFGSPDYERLALEEIERDAKRRGKA